MMTDTLSAPRLVLVLKAQGDFKHSGKYFLHNGRWHKLHADKPAPKGAPVAADPHAAGQHAPAKHFTDDEWSQLKLPPENVNAGSYNKLLDKLKEMSEAGHVTGILGMQFGTNTYGKKAAVVANTLLSLHGSQHTVTPGQKAGEHVAVQKAPDGSLTDEGTKPTEAGHAEGDKWVMPLDAAIQEHNDLVQTAETPTKADDKAELAEQKAELKRMKEASGDASIEQPKIDTSAQSVDAGDTSGLAMPAFLEGKTTGGVVDYYEAVAQKIMNLAAAGDVAGLEQFKADGSKPNSKGKVSNTWKGKTANSKTLLAFYDQAVAQAKGEAPNTPDAAPNIEPAAPSTPANPEPEVKKPPRVVLATKPKPAASGDSSSKLAQIPWDSLLLPDSNKNAKSHNGKVAQIKAMAYAGDIAGLEAFKAGTNTYGKKQNLLAQTALAALKEGDQPSAAAPAPEPAPAAAPQAAPKTPGEQMVDDLKAAGFDAYVSPKHGVVLSKPVSSGAYFPKTYANMAQAEAAVSKLSAAGYDAHVAGSGVPYLVSITGKTAPMQTPAQPAAAAQPDGPKDGDTKQGADGMLVFKNGRWHKQEQPEVAEPAAAAPAIKKLKPSEAIKIMAAVPAKPAKGNKDKMKAMAVAGDVAGLQKFIADNPSLVASKKVAEALIGAMTGGSPAPAAPSAAPKPAAAAAPGGIEAVDSWEQTGPQGGSNPGGRFKDADGVEWYVKLPADDDVAKSEVLAAKLYAALGIAGQDAKLITKGGKLGIASRWVDVKKAGSPADLAKVDGVKSGFGADAWLANWDVVGLGFDNLQVGANGKAVRVDAGGSLTYRAQGGKKAFGAGVTEIDSLRDPKINPQAAAVFGDMTAADITASVAKVLALPDESIKNLVELHGPGDAANRKALADVLIARKADLAQKFPKAAKATKKRLDPNSLPVKEDRLPKPHDFNNWLGTGKPLSSQPHVNAANAAVEQELLALAKTGNLTKLKAFKFHAIDKATGNATGQMLPIAEHPSKHVVQLHADLVMMLDEIANPPQPLKLFHEAEVNSLEQLAAVFPPKKFGTTVNSVHSNEKLGFWVVLGGAHGAKKFAPQKVMDYSAAAIKAGHEKYKQASKLAKHFINSVQASGSYNDLFRDGKIADHHGNKLTDVAQAALEHATTMPEGTSLYRWQNMPDDMVKKIMSAPDGTVFQATGPMCTSYSPTATQGFGQHRVVVRYAKGAKAVESFGSGAFSGEKEVTTLPNARFVIISKKMVPSEKYGGKQRLELEVLMLPPDLGI